MTELAGIVGAVQRPGQHVVVYGERGVGKTSLVTIGSVVLSMLDTPPVVLSVSATTEATFTSLWRQVFTQVALVKREPGFGRTAQAASLADDLPRGALTVERVRGLLSAFAHSRRVVVIVDEFDRLSRGRVHAQFADLIKMLSDAAVPVAIVVVGVAESIDSLIGEHASIDRCLDQVRMPRMSDFELRDIITRGLQRARMSADPASVQSIVALSRGLPHYTHSLALGAALSALARQQIDVTRDDVIAATVAVVERHKGSVAAAYTRAVVSPHSEHLYGKVLVAAALAGVDDRGFFAPADVRVPLERLTGRNYAVATFMRHLYALCGSSRAAVLQREGSQGRYRFRFADPLLQPYVLMRALADGTLDLDGLRG